MTTSRPRRSYPALIALIPVLFLSNGCTQDTAPLSTITATVTAAPTTAPASAAGETQAVPAPETPAAPTVTWTRQAKPAEAKPVEAKPDAERFRGLDKVGYFFTSPSGNLHCGFREENFQYMGCQSRSTVASLPRCDDPSGMSAPSISLARGGEGYPDCLEAGVFTDRGARVLEYGQLLEVGAYTCSSSESGVKCDNTADGHGFSASRKEFAGW